MNVIERIRELSTGHYESKPLKLMGSNDAAQWIAEHPTCSVCSEGIAPRIHDYTIESSSDGWTTQYHAPCPSLKP